LCAFTGTVSLDYRKKLNRNKNVHVFYLLFIKINHKKENLYNYIFVYYDFSLNSKIKIILIDDLEIENLNFKLKNKK
jgi:hypothetical protein